MRARRRWFNSGFSAYGNLGQSQLLAVMTISTAMMTAGLFALDRSRNASTGIVRHIRRTELLQVLSASAEWVQKIYQLDAVCDPVRLDLILDQICLDGTRCIGTDVASRGLRQMKMATGSREMTVSFGRVTPLSRGAALTGALSGYKGDPTRLQDPFSDSGYQPLPAGDARTVVPQPMWSPPRDTKIELWTSAGQLRVSQQVILVNVCSHPMLLSSSSPYDPVSMPRPAHAYRSVLTSTFSSPAVSGTCRGARQEFGDLNTDAAVDGIDLEILQAYIRTRLVPTNAFASPGGGDPLAESVFLLRADVSCDGVVDEKDLGVLEKFLRGYLWAIPTFVGGA